jgi:hypothetical protein
VSKNKKDRKEPEDQPEVQTAAEETAPQPSKKVDNAVKKALEKQAPGVQQIELQPCPCGTVGVNLLVDLPQGSKVGHGTCGSCGVWGVDVLAPRSNDEKLIANAAAKAWNEAPRIPLPYPV